jgi:hypothetical protein
MELRITKHSDKPHLIAYHRDNGTITWMYADEFFVLHDLSHFAIEKTLGYTTAFMGMLNQGMEIKDFENREIRNSLTITPEAIYAENMANLFLMERSQGILEDFNQVLKEAFNPMKKELESPVLTKKKIDSIRNYFNGIVEAWKLLPNKETMVFVYQF